MSAHGSALDPYRPPVFEPSRRGERRGHSRLGIASLISALVAWAALFAVFVVAGIGAVRGDTEAASGPVATAAALIAMLATVLGLGCGVACMFVRSRRRTIGVIGLLLSAAITLLFVAMIVYSRVLAPR